MVERRHRYLQRVRDGDAETFKFENPIEVKITVSLVPENQSLSGPDYNYDKLESKMAKYMNLHNTRYSHKEENC